MSAEASPETSITPDVSLPPLRQNWLSRVAVGLCLLIGPIMTLVPMLPHEILGTQNNDLASHTRCAYEYALAIDEGQFPPLVTPLLNSETRVPMFQYYAGTAYILPALLIHFGIGAYTALRASLVIHSFLGGAAMYLLTRRLGAERISAVLGAVALQLLPYTAMNLTYRGSYTEIIAGSAIAVFGYLLSRVLTSTKGGSLRWYGAAILWAAYLLPIHPLQSVMGMALMIGLLSVWVVIDLAAWPRIGRIGLVVAGATAATAWFWWPIMRDYAQLRISGHRGFHDAGTDDPLMLLWPIHRANEVGWAPQIGIFHFTAAIGAVLLVFRRRLAAAGVAAGASTLLLIGFMLWHSYAPPIERILDPLQFTYRLLLPAGIAGSIAVAFVMHVVLHRAQPVVRLVTAGLLLLAMSLIAKPYYGRLAAGKELDPDFVLTPDYRVRDVSLSYALKGTDFRALGWFDAGGRLRLDRPLPIPREGYPTVARLLLRPTGTPTEPLRVSIDGVPAPLQQGQHHGHLELQFTYAPPSGFPPAGNQVVSFTGPPGIDWEVVDAQWRLVDEPAELFVRQPRLIERTHAGRTTQWVVDVPMGGAGQYQIPVCYLPSHDIRVNDLPVSVVSGNKYLVIVKLNEGRNAVTVATRPAFVAWWISVLTMAASGAAVIGSFWQRSGRVDESVSITR